MVNRVAFISLCDCCRSATKPQGDATFGPQTPRTASLGRTAAATNAVVAERVLFGGCGARRAACQASSYPSSVATCAALGNACRAGFEATELPPPPGAGDLAICSVPFMDGQEFLQIAQED